MTSTLSSATHCNPLSFAFTILNLYPLPSSLSSCYFLTGSVTYRLVYKSIVSGYLTPVNSTSQHHSELLCVSNLRSCYHRSHSPLLATGTLAAFTMLSMYSDAESPTDTATDVYVVLHLILNGLTVAFQRRYLCRDRIFS